MFETLRDTSTKSVRLSNEEFAYFLTFLKEKILQKKEFLLRAGEVCSHVAFIRQGCLRYYYLKYPSHKWQGIPGLLNHCSRISPQGCPPGTSPVLPLKTLFASLLRRVVFRMSFSYSCEGNRTLTAAADRLWISRS